MGISNTRAYIAVGSRVHTLQRRGHRAERQGSPLTLSSHDKGQQGEAPCEATSLMHGAAAIPGSEVAGQPYEQLISCRTAARTRQVQFRPRRACPVGLKRLSGPCQEWENPLPPLSWPCRHGPSTRRGLLPCLWAHSPCGLALAAATNRPATPAFSSRCPPTGPQAVHASSRTRIR
jgi:hypothetical protein